MNSQQAINLLNGLEQRLDDYCELNNEGKAAFRMAITALELFGNAEQLPSAQPKQTDCEYCHEDSDGYVRPLEKNCHAFVRYGINGWEISLKAKGWSGSAKIKYCPMCGRELKHG